MNICRMAEVTTNEIYFPWCISSNKITMDRKLTADHKLPADCLLRASLTDRNENGICRGIGYDNDENIVMKGWYVNSRDESYEIVENQFLIARKIPSYATNNRTDIQINTQGKQSFPV